MEQLNSFERGMNLDILKSRQAPNTYRNAVNCRLEPQENGTRGAIVNCNGNELFLTFPTTSNVCQITLSSNFITASTFSFIVNSVTVTVTNTTYAAFFEDVSDAINASTALQALGITSSFSASQVLVWSGLNASNVTISPSVSITMASPPEAVVNNSFVTSQAGVQPIGWVTLRDKLVFLTTNNTTINPGGHDFDTSVASDPSSVGQIWTLDYNPETLVGRLELKYNNYVDFTTYHPIPPTGIWGNYENINIKKIYWTDWFNPLRSFDIQDENCFALSPTLLERRPEIAMEVPILQSIKDSGGKLSKGVYQVAYRLLNNNGYTTHFSQLSNLVNIINDLPDTTAYRKYMPLVTFFGTHKLINWKIVDLDTSFDRIEIALVFKSDTTSDPIINVVANEPVPQNGTFNFVTDDITPTNSYPLDINTLLNIPSDFSHCKTIAVKDGLLIAANLKEQQFDVNFDARAYRWRSVHSSTPHIFSSNRTEVYDSQGTELIVDKTSSSSYPNQWGVPEQHDAINADQFTQTPDSYRFQSDGVTLGGEGPNIKYTFKVHWFIGDQNLSGGGFGAMNLDSGAGPVGENARFVGNNPAVVSLNGNDYSLAGFYDSFKSPYITSAFKGYQPDEVYAFAFQVWDKKGRPGFSKWIADIRMPVIFENDGTTGSGTIDHPFTRVSNYGGFLQQEIGILVPEFTVTIPSSLREQIGHWGIVRCERTTQDRTVMASGSIHPVQFDSFGATYYSTTTQDRFIDPNVESAVVGFKSPEFSFNSFPGHSPGDSIKILGALGSPYAVSSTTPASPDNFMFVKNYTFYNTALLGIGATEKSLDAAFFISRDGTATMPVGGLTVLNRVQYTPTNKQQSYGENIVVLDFRSAPNQLVPIGSEDKYYAIYKRANASQYGGNTYSERSNRTYISCGHYRPINDSTVFSPNAVFTDSIFGGDIYTTIWDCQRVVKDWIAPLSAGDFRSSWTFYLPVQTKINTEWRYGTFPNSDGYPDSGTGGDTGEDYLYYATSLLEDNLRVFYPKPTDFSLIKEFDTRIQASSVKINGESSDSWLKFPTNDYWEVDGAYGPINAIFIYNGQLLFLQDSAFGIEPVNQRVLIEDNSSSTLQLGTGKVLEKHSYITNQAGSKHQYGVVVSNGSVYFFDAHTKRLYRYAQGLEQLSEIQGLSSYLENNLVNNILTKDNPVYKDPNFGGARSGIVMGVDKRFNEILITFMGGSTLSPSSGESSFTVSYNELVKAFVSFHDFKPSMYIYDGFSMFTPNKANPSQLWIHNRPNYGSYYGTIFDSIIGIVINPHSQVNKVFDNVSFYSEVLDGNIDQQLETFSRIRFYTDYQNSDYIVLDPLVTKNIKREERTWNITTFRDAVLKNLVNSNIFDPANLSQTQTFKARFRDKTLVQEFIYNNLLGRKFILHWVKNLFRISQR